MYNQLNLDNKYVTTSTMTNPKIVVEYNNTPIHSITGPVPVVDISYGINSNSNNLPESFSTSINLNGKIFRHPEGVNLSNVDVDKAHPGFSGIMAGISGLKSLFVDCPYGSLKFKCDDVILYEVSGLSVKDIQISNTQDNWVQSADYTISLEVITSVFDSDDEIERYVTDRSDSWNIEPIEDTVFSDLSFTPSMRPELHNPLLGISPTNSPPVDLGSGQTNGINIVNVPQFRITRRLSAKGLLPPGNQICNTGLYNANTKPYVFAKAWVESMSKKAFQANEPDNSSPYIKIPFEQNLFAFNHNRTVNLDIFNGTYETNDTWLAMPRGVPYTETYTIECSTSEDFTKTVRVAGSIVGLTVTDQNIMQHDVGVLPTGVGDDGLIDAKLDLIYSNTEGQEGGSYSSLDSTSSPLPGRQGLPPSQTIKNNRFENALNAWTYHIKPFLYRRASLGINSPDRTVPYIPAYSSNPPAQPNNPIFSRESLLSTVPNNTSESFDPRKGTVNYSYEFNNKNYIIPGVISENITVTSDNPVDSTSETPVIGRALGPIIQRTGRTSPKKSISIEISIPPISNINEISMNSPQCPLHKDGYLFQAIEQIIEAHRPYSSSAFLNDPVQTLGLVYTSSDNENWSPHSGKYSRSVSWVYQQCNLGQNFRDH